jgi:hypothetical protein
MGAADAPFTRHPAPPADARALGASHALGPRHLAALYAGTYVEHQQRVSHLFGPMPPEMRQDTALMDRIHAYIPGWDVPKMSAAVFTNQFGPVNDFPLGMLE